MEGIESNTIRANRSTDNLLITGLSQNIGRCQAHNTIPETKTAFTIPSLSESLRNRYPLHANSSPK